MKEKGIADVHIPPESAPEEFWETVIIATHEYLAAEGSDSWADWEREFRWAHGLKPFYFGNHWVVYERLLRDGYINFEGASLPTSVDVALRYSAVEHLVEIVGDEPNFASAVNDRARFFRVGVRFENKRWIPLTSEHVHKEVIQPTLLLLAEPRWAEVDELYRKAFNRSLAGDAAGAITNAMAAVEEMLRQGLGVEGQTLDPLVKKASKEGWVEAPVNALIVRLAALRDASDAHSLGTNEAAVATLALNVSASVLLFLGTTASAAE